MSTKVTGLKLESRKGQSAGLLVQKKLFSALDPEIPGVIWELPDFRFWGQGLGRPPVPVEV